MCDNSTNPKELTEGKDNVALALTCVKSVKAKHKAKYFVDLLTGNKTAEIKTYQGINSPYFGKREMNMTITFGMRFIVKLL